MAATAADTGATEQELATAQARAVGRGYSRWIPPWGLSRGMRADGPGKRARIALAGLNALAMVVRSCESSQLRVSDLNLRQSERLGFCTDDLPRKEITGDGFAGDCAIRQSDRVFRGSPGERR